MSLATLRIGIDQQPLPIPSPLVMALFPIQLSEWMEARDEEPSAPVLEVEVVNPDEAEQQALRGLEQAVGEAAARMEALKNRLDEAIEQSLSWLKSPQAPALLTLDLYIHAMAMASQVRDQDDPEARRSLPERLGASLGPELRAELRQRCIAHARAARSPEERDSWTALAMALEADPGRVVLAAIANPRCPTARRSEEEARVLSTIPPGASDLLGAHGPYLAWLKERDEAAARRLEQGLRVLQDAMDRQRFG